MVSVVRNSFMTTVWRFSDAHIIKLSHERPIIASRHTPTNALACGLGAWTTSRGTTLKTFLQDLHVQRWDDHRYYHQSRVNQFLHLISAMSFLVAYGVMFKSPALAALIAWFISMGTRQSGHFFFEPKGYDRINHATHEYKEAIKVGYNLQRKVVLMAVWALSPLLLMAKPDLFGMLEAHTTWQELALNVGWIWFWVGVGALLFRMITLFIIKDVRTGVIWICKIITDPFHDIMLYHTAPMHLLRREWFEEPESFAESAQERGAH
jgi:hypothetical protein